MIASVRLALSDLWGELRLTICGLLAYSAILTPLLILFALKSGLVNTMTSRLLDDPLILEITPVGSGGFDEAWFAEKRTWPEITFVVPKTRSLSASVVVSADPTPGNPVLNAELIPTGLGDPLLGMDAILPEPGEAVLSAELARRLSLADGDTISVLLNRKLNEQNETHVANLNIVAVAPERNFSRTAIWTEFAFLRSVEDFRDGLSVPAFGVDGNTPVKGAPEFASFRMYAKDLGHVSKLRDRLMSEGLNVRTQAGRIEDVLGLAQNITTLYWLIATVASVGFTLALGASLWASVQRKTATLSLIRLLGLNRAALSLFPLVQGLVVSTCAFLLSLLLSAVVAIIINGIYSADGGADQIAQLSLAAVIGGLLGTVIVATLASLLSVRAVFLIDPDTGLRHAT